MKLEIKKDEDGAIIGFTMVSEGDAEEEFFNMSLPSSLVKGTASMDVVGDKLIILNSRESPGKYELSLTYQDASELKAIFANPNIRPKAGIKRGFGCHFVAEFERL